MSSSENPIRVLVVGRFQPLHNGHVSLIEQALELGDVVLVVGSAQKSRSWDNPFNCRERIEMLKSTIKKKGWNASRFTIIPVEDIHSNELWVAKIEMMTPDFHTVMTGNPLVEHLFKKRGYVVVRPKHLQPKINSGENIRKILRRKKHSPELCKLVPAPVLEIICNPELVTFFQNQKS